MRPERQFVPTIYSQSNDQEGLAAMSELTICRNKWGQTPFSPPQYLADTLRTVSQRHNKDIANFWYLSRHLFYA